MTSPGMLSWLLIGLCLLFALIMGLRAERVRRRKLLWWALSFLCSMAAWWLFFTITDLHAHWGQP